MGADRGTTTARKTLDDAILTSRLDREWRLQTHCARLRFEVEKALGNADAVATALEEADRVARVQGALMFSSRRIAA